MFQLFKRLSLSDKEIELVKYGELNVKENQESYRVYLFDIKELETKKIVGRCDLRIGEGEELYYIGNIGYTVYLPYRGNRYAYKACKLLFKFAKSKKMKSLIITCNPQNIASFKTIRALNSVLIGEKDVPKHLDIYKQGDYKKCIFEIQL